MEYVFKLMLKKLSNIDNRLQIVYDTNRRRLLYIYTVEEQSLKSPLTLYRLAVIIFGKGR